MRRIDENYLPGNGNSVIGVAKALSVIIIGEADHFIHTLVIKYTDNANTNMNMITKKHLFQKKMIIFYIFVWLKL